jgi:hypothetical protein
MNSDFNRKRYFFVILIQIQLINFFKNKSSDNKESKAPNELIFFHVYSETITSTNSREYKY